MHRTAALALSLVLLAACPSGEEEEWEARSQTDEGSVCLDDAAGDGSAEITVWSGLCLSSSCSRDVQASCTATYDGTTLTVSSQFDWEEQVAPGIACTEDCQNPSATCTVSGLPTSGDITVEHGTDSETLTLPTGDDCTFPG